MLHYILETRDEPLSWRDVEALPFYVFGLMVLLAIVQLGTMVGPVLQAMLIKAVLVVGVLGLRAFLLSAAAEGDADEAEQPAPRFAAETATA